MATSYWFTFGSKPPQNIRCRRTAPHQRLPWVTLSAAETVCAVRGEARPLKISHHREVEMIPILFRVAVLTVGLTSALALAQNPQIFPDATESDAELIELYDHADAQCRLSTSHDVKNAVACHSRSIYGAALNERNWCFGRETEANAQMVWHECQSDSMRFPELNFDIW
jgi:hypothetical protein